MREQALDQGDVEPAHSAQHPVPIFDACPAAIGQGRDDRAMVVGKLAPE